MSSGVITTPRVDYRRHQFLPILVAVAASAGFGGLGGSQGTRGLAVGIGVLLLGVWIYLATKAPLVLALFIPASLLGLLLPLSVEIVVEACMAGIAVWWALTSFYRGDAPGAAIASLCVPLLWAVLLLNKNVPDLHTGMLGLRKATLVFVGLALGLLWPLKGRAQAVRAIPWILLGAGVLNLVVHLGAPGIEQGFVRAADVYTSSFGGVHRMQGVYGGPFHIALLGVFLVLFGWQTMIAGARVRGLPFVVVGLLLTYFSEVRSAYLVIATGVILLGVFGRPAQPGKWMRIGAQLGLVACGAALVFAFASPTDTALTSIGGLGHDQRALGRLQQWSMAGDLIVASPLYGWGPGSAGSTLDRKFVNDEHVTSHDSALTFLVEGGVIGLGLVILTAWLTLRSARGWLRACHPGVVAADHARGHVAYEQHRGGGAHLCDSRNSDWAEERNMTSNMTNPSMAGVPMHGETKLRGEGLRTRDGHLLEWLTILRPTSSIAVYSRPEPWPRVTWARAGGARMPSQLAFVSPEPRTIPNFRHRRDWWVRSLRFMTFWSNANPAVVWNPIAGAAAIERAAPEAPVAFDLLDDWLVHPAFGRLHEHVARAYEIMFTHASIVTANSEATLALAHRFGRDDAVLLRNGVDPERFSLPPSAHRQVTVGYGGKLGFRIDVELVAAAAAAFPHARFEFVGPVLVKEQARALRRIPNVVLVGDVRYDLYPSVMRRWDVAWAPHRLREFEVGGDLIKLYEYRAAGLPTVSTRVIGWQRALDGVRAMPREDIVQGLADIIGGRRAGEIPREPIGLPPEMTWRSKAEYLLERLGVDRPSSGAVAPEAEAA